MDTDKQPYEIFLEVVANRGAEYHYPECGRLCKAHNFHEFNWRHLNFFQHHCYVAARVPLGGLPRPRDQAGQDALNPRGQPVHLAV
ncbi:hypothetical protein DFAR_940003 [Desulfarculales bacterium]